MTPTVEAIVAVLGSLGGAGALGAGIKTGTASAWKFLVTDPIKRADDEAARERMARASDQTAHVRDLEAMRAERDYFKVEWKAATADGRELRRRYERALGLPVSELPPPRGEQPTLVGFDLRRDDAAFLAALAVQEAERELPTRPETPQPFRAPDPEQTPRRPVYASARVDDARKARDPSGPRPPLPRPRTIK